MYDTILTMKTLKLDHTLALAVLNGTKKSTWRVKDDKDLSVDDEIEFIDKVDHNRPDTWRVIGRARVNEVNAKRLSDITDDELEDHNYGSREQMLNDFRRYYGDDVGEHTPVKIIHFSFEPYEIPMEPVRATLTHKAVKLFADGGSRGNPGKSASGYAILDVNDNVIMKGGVYLGITTNNQAEYQALRFGLEEARKLGAQEVDVYMDSMLVVNQMKGVFKVKNRDLWPIHESIKEQVSKFKKVKFTHVPRELNKLADAEVNETLDAEATK
jgi:ribonuclease HI